MRRLSASDAALQRLQAWAFWLAFGAVVGELWIALPVEASTALTRQKESATSPVKGYAAPRIAVATATYR